MIKYNNTNNASTTLTAWISPSSTTLIVENGDILPTAPFLLTLEHFDNEKVTVREIVKCIAKAWNILTIQRGAWTCVQDDSATPKVQNNTPHSFSVWDCASIYWTSEQVQDIQNEIEKKLNIDDFQAWTYVYGATSTWTDAYSITIPWTLTSYSVGQVFRFMADVQNTWNATLNVNWIWAIEILKNHDKHLESGDIEAWQIVEVAFDGTSFQMNSQIATVVDLWNIDSLKMSGVVGELYTLDDELYIQDVSQDLNTEEWTNVINVWYDKEETHIQRIANGTSGNSISLYVAKVWSPTTNFTVEIRKGIYAEADGRAYWTGDSTQILASKSIPYSSFTTDFQKITIVFDENIELQRGEFIDVVCYQSWVWDEKIKSTTNYFTIEWYWNKLGEWNSVNYVDNGTITKTVFIAYCQSDIFENRVFSKAKKTITTTANFKRTLQGQWVVQYLNGVLPDRITVFSYSATGSSVTMNVKGSVYMWSSSFGYIADGWAETEIANVWSTVATRNFDTTITFTKNITFYIKSTSNSSAGSDSWNFVATYSDVSTNNFNITWKTVSVISVANETSIITEWKVNEKRYTQHENKEPFEEVVATIAVNNSTWSYVCDKNWIYKITNYPNNAIQVKLNWAFIFSWSSYSSYPIIYDWKIWDVIEVFSGAKTRATITYSSRNISIITV